jgi:hypothetical protein
VRKPENLILVDAIAKRYGQRPSKILGIGDDPYLAYQVDLTVLHIGLEREAENKKKSRGSTGQGHVRETSKGKKFTDDPKAYRSWGRPSKRMKIPESGVW